MSKRNSTKYPGIFFREAKRIGGAGTEKVYYVVYKKNGKHHEEKAGRQFADAMTPAKAANIRSGLIEGKRLCRKEKKALEQTRKEAEAGKWTIQKLWDSYNKGRTIGKSLSTDKSRYEKYLKTLLGDKEPKNILALDINRQRIKLLKKKSPQTVLHILNLLTWIINFGVKNGLCPGLSFHIKKPTAQNLVTEDLTPEQIKKLLDVIDADTHPHAGPMMKLALFTGMRRGEMFKLKWNHIDTERGFITIRDPKGGEDQTIPLNDSAHDLLESHPRTQSPFVFPGRNGNQRVNISKAVNEIKKKAGLPVKFRPLHGLRHVFASMLASSGKVDMYVLQKLLTHKGPTMTQRYAHLRDDTLKNASGIAASIIEEVAKGTKKNKPKTINIGGHSK